MPVYMGIMAETGISEITGYLPATEVNVDYNTTHTPRRLLGRDLSSSPAAEQLASSAPLTANISFSCVLEKDFEEAFVFYDDEYATEAFPIKIGDNIFQKCYVDEISISVAPYVPVTLNARFSSLEPATGQSISGDATPRNNTTIPITPDDLTYGHTCSVENMGNVVGDVQSQINFKKSYKRSPVYTLGSVVATSMPLEGIDKEMSITSTGLNDLITFSGNMLSSSVKVNLTSQAGQGIDYIEDIAMDVGARISVESYGVAGGETVETRATITQGIL